ncbi:hypothetical protein FH972_026635 [Carpinus fangiana]|uniref:Protein kinase domain-containing protein n=1 Tax=Carpinus fangiana TaxID=176857 RepID=A0A5N6L4K0_9ROSI|nr:hypothetical protein FH972_026635 [Carpinus fangiana]
MAVSSELIRTRAGLRNDHDTEEQVVDNDTYSPLNFVHPLIFLHDQWSRANRSGVPVSGHVKSSHQLPVLGKGLSFTVRAGTFQIDGLEPSPSHVAMKIPNLNFTPSSVKTKAETDRARSILNEVHILTHEPLRMHGNIVQLLALSWTEASSDDDSLVLMMLMAPAMSGTLADLQSQKKSLSYDLKMRLCDDVSQGLQALHVCGVVHGDVKSENVLVFTAEDGHMIAKVSDFGTAVVLDFTSNGTIEDDPDYYLPASTRLWMAPEASGPVRRSKLHLTDIYSFGLLAWRVLIDGANPFDEFDMPRDIEARSAKIETIKREFSAGHAGMAIAKIENSLGIPSSSLQSFSLLWLFLCTIQCAPEKRSLSAALNHGKHHEPYVAASPTSRSQADVRIRVIPNIDQFRLSPIQFDMLKTSAVDCVNTRRLDTKLQHQLVNAYRETLDAATSIIGQNPANLLAQSYVLQCSWVLIIFRFGSIGKWNGSLAEDVLPLAFTVLQLAKGREKHTVLSLLFSLAETYPETKSVFKFSEIIDAASQAALEGVFSALFFLRRYRASGLTGKEYFFGRENTEELSEDTAAALDRLDGLARISTETHELDGEQGELERTEKLVIGIQSLLSEQMSPVRNEKSPLLRACHQGQTRQVAALLGHDHDAAILSPFGESCLHWLYAFPEEDMEKIANQLYAQGADPLAVAEDPTAESQLESSRHKQLGLIYKDNPLCRSVSVGSLAAVKELTRLLQKVDIDTSAKYSILYEVSVLAASLHMAEILKHIILELESQCYSVLEESLGKWRFEIWRSHLFRGATLVEVETCRFSLHGKLWDKALKDTFIVLDDYGDIPELVSPIIAMAKKPTHPIFMAIKLGSQRVCTHIVLHTRWGADTEVIDPSTGYTALCWAMQENWIDFFDALVQRGAILDLQGQYPEEHFLADARSTYLHLCAEMKSSKYFAEELIRRGIPTGLADKYDRSALFLCICGDAVDTARVLVHHGEDLNQTDADGFTLIGQLLRQKNRRRINHLECALKEFGVILNAIVHEEKQLTVFHMAAGLLSEVEQSQGIMQILLPVFPVQYVNFSSARGAYPFHEAITSLDVTAFELLQKVRADLDVKDPYGNDLLEVTRVLMLGATLDKMEQKKYATRLAERTENLLDAVENAKEWPNSGEFFRLVRRLEHELEPIVEKSALIDHADVRRRQIFDLVASACRSVDMVLTDWLEVHEFGRHIHRVISPTFTLRLHCFFEADGHSNLSEEDMQQVYEKHPWMVRGVSDRQLSGLQQGAVMHFYFMRIRDKLRAAKQQGIAANLDRDEALFAKYAERPSAAGWPYSQATVNYPNGLLHDWSYALGNHRQKAQLPEGMFEELATWNALHEAGSLDAIGFSPEFEALHFQPPLQKVELCTATRIKPVFKWALYCSCVDRPFESFSEKFVTSMVQRHGHGPRVTTTGEDAGSGLLREADRCFHQTHYLPIEMPPMKARPGFEPEGGLWQPFLCGVEGEEHEEEVGVKKENQEHNE